MKTIVLSFCLLFISSLIIAQDDVELLKKQLDTAKNSQVKTDIINDLALIEINNDPELAREYATEAKLLAKEHINITLMDEDPSRLKDFFFS